jgi:hypothetical protein
VNLLLMANEFGSLIAQVFTYCFMLYVFPQMLFNPPA